MGNENGEDKTKNRRDDDEEINSKEKIESKR
jgi:hypothetical protein